MDSGERVERILMKAPVQRTMRYLAKRDKEGECTIGRILEAYGRRDLPARMKLKYALPHAAIDWLAKRSGSSRDEFREGLGITSIRRALVTACRSIGEFGLVKPQVFSSPLVVVWNFTQMCNLRCRHCYQDAGAKAADELSIEQKFHVLDELAENDVPMLAFSGGEPLMSPDFWPALAHAKAKQFHVSVATNGTLLTPVVVERLADAGADYVEVSIDSVHPEKHDAFRGGKGYWARSMRGLENLARSRRPMKISMASTITRLNFDELEDLLKLATDMGLDYFYVFNFIPTGRGKDIVDLDLDPEQRETMIEFMKERLNEGKIEVMGTVPQYGRKCLEHRLAGQIVAIGHHGSSSHEATKVFARYIGGCAVGRCMLAIQPNGDVTPCVFLPIVFGNLSRKPLREIWRGSDLLGKFRDRSILGGNCGICDWQLYCGGCRARAYGYFEDVTAADPGCIYNGPVWDRLKANAEETAPSGLRH